VDGSIDVVIGSAPEPAVVVALHGECVSKVGFNQRIEGKYGAPTGTESMCSCHSGFCVMNRLQDCGTCNAARVEQLKSPSRLARGERLTRLELIEVISTSTRQTLLASRVSTVVSPKLDSSLAMGSAWAENTLDNFRKLRTAADPAAWKLGEIEGEDNAAQLRMIAVVALRRAYILGVFERGWTAEERIERGMVVR